MYASGLIKQFRIVTCLTLGIFLLYGLTCTIFPVFPLWIDELTIADNLKFKSPQQLWHVLDHTQQFPRVYLQLIKAFCADANYSYLSFRLPAFLNPMPGCRNISSKNSRRSIATR